MKKILTLAAALCMLIGTNSVSASEKLVIKGSTTVLPVAQVVAESFMKDYPEIKVTLSGGGSGNGIKALLDGTTNIADASRFIKKKEVKKAVEKGVYPVPFKVALDAIVPVVNKANIVKDLSLDDLKNIYLGRIRNWKKLGGPDMKIVVVSRDSSSGTYEVWDEIVLKKRRVTPRALTVASNGAVVQAVQSTKGAIGYIGLGYLNKDINMVTVGGVAGSEKTTQSGEYPVARALFMFTDGWPEGPTAKFINYIQSVQGQKLVKKAGSIPIF